MSKKRSKAPIKSSIEFQGRTFAFFGAFAYWPSYHAGQPVDVARRRHALIQTTVDEKLDFLVLGDRRGSGRSEAKKKAENLRLKAEKNGTRGRPTIFDESAYRELVRLDVTGKRFAFFGSFDCAPAGFEDGLLRRMVEAVGGIVAADVDEHLDYLVLGNRRGEGKIKARNRAEQLQTAGSALQILDEAGFLELARSEQPQSAASMDFAGFITRLNGAVDQAKLGRALAMLKSEAFKLYVHLSDERLIGVVRSQSGSGNVYASWLTPTGHYGCATPDLANCMGLQGSPCKHLLVLLVGLSHAGVMDLGDAYAWIHATVGKGPRRDTEITAETFLQYKGAEAGEIDWRPTETIPEDFYSF